MYRTGKNYCVTCDADVEPTISLVEHKADHYAEARCPNCNKWLYWVGKPDNQKKLEHRPNGCPTPKDLSIDYCQICLNEKAKVHNQFLETHHIDNNPANNDRLNLLVVCRACHRLIHWTRTYLND